MPVPVMSLANTNTEPKYQNANTSTGTVVWAPLLNTSIGNGLCLYRY